MTMTSSIPETIAKRSGIDRISPAVKLQPFKEPPTRLNKMNCQLRNANCIHRGLGHFMADSDIWSVTLGSRARAIRPMCPSGDSNEFVRVGTCPRFITRLGHPRHFHNVHIESDLPSVGDIGRRDWHSPSAPRPLCG